MPAICGGMGTDIHSHIEEAAAQHANQLRLGNWGKLEMQSPYRANRYGERLIILNERGIDPQSMEMLRVVRFREITAVVPKLRRLDQNHFRNCGGKADKVTR